MTESLDPNLGEKPTILNSGLDVKNTMSKKEFQKVLMRTFEEVRAILSNHVGPYSRYAMVATSDWTEPVFTKDGVNIIRAFSYASKLQKILVKNITYLGDREEVAAGDGTTSAMILGSTGILELMKEFADCPYNYTVAELESYYTDVFVNKVGRYLDDLACKPGDPDQLREMHERTGLEERDIVYKLAFLQAYTSSHGNRELANIVATFFANNPREVWDYTTIESERYETDKDITVIQDDAQFTIEHVTLTPIEAWNRNLGTMYEIDEETEIILFVESPAIGIESHIPLLEKIKDAIENNKKLCVIMPSRCDNQTEDFFTDLLKKTRCRTVGFVRTGLTQFDVNDLRTLSYILGNEKLKPFVTKGWTAKLAGDSFFIMTGLYPEGTKGKNPYIGDCKNHQALNDYILGIDQQIKILSNDRSQTNVAETIDRLNKHAIKVRTVGHTFIKLGGMQYDHLRNRDIVADALIGTRKALIKGIVPGANITMKQAINLAVSFVADDQDERKKFFVNAVAKALISGIDYIQDILFRSAYRDINVKRDDPKVFSFEKPGDLITLKNYDSIDDFLVACADDDTLTIATEPVTMAKEFLKRFGDLALKFLRTETIIVPMSYYLPEEEKDEHTNSTISSNNG